MVSGEARTKSVLVAPSYQPHSCICRLFAREDSKHMVQIAGLQELQVDSVELLLEVINSSFFITPPQQYKYRDQFILLLSKYSGLIFRQKAMTSTPLHIYKM